VFFAASMALGLGLAVSAEPSEETGLKGKPVTLSGCVITGGAVMIEGCTRTAERALDLPVKLGYPRGVGGLTDLIAQPSYATAVGVIRHAAQEPPQDVSHGPLLSRVRHRLSDFLREYM